MKIFKVIKYIFLVLLTAAVIGNSYCLYRIGPEPLIYVIKYIKLKIEFEDLQETVLYQNQFIKTLTEGDSDAKKETDSDEK